MALLISQRAASRCGIVVSVLWIVGLALEAHAADVDWKLYGAASIAGPEMCFYEANGILHTVDGNVRAWTKCLPKQDMDAINAEHDDLGGKIVKNTIEKVESGYVPPIVVAGGMNFDQLETITAYEETANISDIM